MRVSIRNNKGFSLVELMVVVAIIGILAAIAIPNFQRFTAKSKQSEAKANLAMIYSAERAFNSEWQLYNTRFKIVGYAPTGTMRYQSGFLTDFPTVPTNYTGPTAGVALEFSTTTYCTQGAGAPTNGCNIVTVPTVPGALPASTASAIAFTAAATGDIVGAGTMDQWSIDQLKTITNVQNGLP